MPLEDGVRLDDHEAGAPPGPQSRQPHPECPVSLAQPWPPHGLMQDGKFLTEAQDLGSDRAARHEKGPKNDHNGINDAPPIPSTQVACGIIAAQQA